MSSDRDTIEYFKQKPSRMKKVRIESIFKKRSDIYIGQAIAIVFPTL